MVKDCHLYNLLDLNENYYAMSYKTPEMTHFDVIDKRDNSTSHTLQCEYLKSLNGGNFVKICDNRLILMNEKFKVLSENHMQDKYDKFEAINENLFVSTSFKGYECHVRFRNISGENIGCRVEKGEVKEILNVYDKNVLYFTERKICVTDFNGQIVNRPFGFHFGYKNVRILSDTRLLAFLSFLITNSVEIWNYRLCKIERVISNGYFVGSFPLGFLIRFNDNKFPLVLHAYDKEFEEIGAILTDTISDKPITKVISLGHS